MRKGLLFATILAACTLGIVACNQSGPSVPDVSITNKDVITADWYVEDADRPLNITIADGTPVADAIYDGDLVVTSSDETIVSVGSSSLDIHAVKKGTATITATYKKTKSDSVQVEVKTRPTMRVATTIDTTKTDYMIRWYANGKTLFASDEMNGFYVKPVDIDNAKNVSITEDSEPDGDYKYVIKIGTKTLGKYDGSHKNIGFVGDQVDDGGAKDIVKALFKYDNKYRLVTKFKDTTDATKDADYYLAAYGGSRDDRLAYQTENNIPDAAFARPVEYGDPIPATSVTLDKTELTLKAGAQARLSATIEPSISTDVIKWESSDESVVKVADGLVVAYKEGTAKIYAVANENVKGECAVTVSGSINYGTTEAPLTPDQAHDLLAENFSDGSQTPFMITVRGRVYSREQAYADDVNSHKLALYKADGTFEAKYLTVYGAKYEGTIAAGYTVVAKGYAKIYSNEYELAPGKGLGETKNTNPDILDAEEGSIPLTGIELTLAKSSVDISDGAKTVQATVAPVPENATLGTVTYSVSPADAGVTVSAEGLVSVAADAVATKQEATYTITATCGTLNASATLKVTNGSSAPVDSSKIVFAEITPALENGVQYTDPFEGEDFTITFSGGSNDGKYYTTGSGIRTYGGGKFVVASTRNILKIVCTWDGSNKPNDASQVTPGTYVVDTGVWTGEAKSIEFARPSGSGHWRLQAVEVFYVLPN